MLPLFRVEMQVGEVEEEPNDGGGNRSEEGIHEKVGQVVDGIGIEVADGVEGRGRDRTGLFHLGFQLFVDLLLGRLPEAVRGVFRRPDDIGPDPRADGGGGLFEATAGAGGVGHVSSDGPSRVLLQRREVMVFQSRWWR